MTSISKIKQRIAEGASLDNLADDLQRLSINEIAAMLLELLSRDDEAHWHASTLLRDLILVSPIQPSVCDAFQAAYQRNELGRLVERLEQGLCLASFNVRKWSTYTLGKIGSARSLGKMREAFSRSLEFDPLLINSLVFEIAWISKSHDELQQLVDMLVRSESYLNRWAAVDVIRDKGSEDSFTDALRILQHDAHVLVKKAANQINDPIADAIYFSDVCRLFTHQLAGQQNYTVPELTCFIDQQMASGG